MPSGMSQRQILIGFRQHLIVDLDCAKAMSNNIVLVTVICLENTEFKLMLVPCYIVSSPVYFSHFNVLPCIKWLSGMVNY